MKTEIRNYQVQYGRCDTGENFLVDINMWMTLIVCIIVIMNDAIHDEIVVLSSERVEVSEFLFEETPSTQNSSYSKRVDASELRRRRIARIVGAVAIFFIVFSCVLLGISFNMSDDINDKGNVNFEAKLTVLCYRRFT